MSAETDIPEVERQAPPIRVLLVDDNDIVRRTLELVFKRSGFDVATAANVNDALRLIGGQIFDVLLSDLHMPHPGDGLTVVSAMRHSNPKAVTIILSAYPEMKQASAAILLQTDDILVKPMNVELLVKTIRERLAASRKPGRSAVESIATILKQETQATIEDWLQAVRREPAGFLAPLDDDQRCAHLPKLFQDLISRLSNPLPLGTRALVSSSAANHGSLRRSQGYSAAMLVEESRMLQVSIFQTLQDNLSKIDFSKLLVEVMAIADEVDSQLAQQMAGYVAAAQAGQERQIAS
jgi:CheY-like chemotaxis protein